MKNTVESILDINEGKNSWNIVNGASGRVLSTVGFDQYLWINLESQEIGSFSEKRIESFASDFGDEHIANELKKLKVGEVYDADGGINIYIKLY